MLARLLRLYIKMELRKTVFRNVRKMRAKTFEKGHRERIVRKNLFFLENKVGDIGRLISLAKEGQDIEMVKKDSEIHYAIYEGLKEAEKEIQQIGYSEEEILEDDKKHDILFKEYEEKIKQLGALI